MMEERGESKVLVKAFSCRYQKGFGKPKNNIEDSVTKAMRVVFYS